MTLYVLLLLLMFFLIFFFIQLCSLCWPHHGSAQSAAAKRTPIHRLLKRRKVRQWQVAVELIYGQVKKSYRRRKLVGVTRVMRLGTQTDLSVALQGLGLSGRLNTAFIERVNLTVRHGVSALARRTWATAQQAPLLLAHLEWWRAYYHFVRPHASLRLALGQPRERDDKLVSQRYRQRTPAVAAGRTNRRWTAREVLSCPLPPLSA